MLPLKVLEYPHKALKTVCTAVTEFDDDLRVTVKAMLNLMYEDRGCGLAANQAGILKRIVVMDVSSDYTEPRCYINPEIIETQGEIFHEEGCLSLPGIFPKVKRAVNVTFRYHDEFGECHTLEADDLLAHCIQHEIDHLNGILSIDRISPLKRALYIKKIEKSQRQAS